MFFAQRILLHRSSNTPKIFMFAVALAVAVPIMGCTDRELNDVINETEDVIDETEDVINETEDVIDETEGVIDEPEGIINETGGVIDETELTLGTNPVGLARCETTYITNTYFTEKSIFGISGDKTYNKGICGNGYVRGECSAWQDSSVKNEDAHCEAQWASSDPKDCTCKVHYGAKSNNKLHCNVRVSRKTCGGSCGDCFVESCLGKCGKKSDGSCWCDDQCTRFGDCCADYRGVCI